MQMMKIKDIGVGIDIESIARFENLQYEQNKAFYNKVFTKKEISYCLRRGKPSQHFAARFAAKEAVFKALENFNVRIALGQIEIVLNKSRVPSARIIEKKSVDKETAKKASQPIHSKSYDIRISISHSAGIAAASAIACKNDCTKSKW